MEEFKLFNGSVRADDDIVSFILQADIPDKRVFSMEVESRIENLVKVRQKADEFFRKLLIDLEPFMLGMHELLVNAMEHGHNFDPGEKIKVHFSATPRYIQIIIEDEGAGFDWRRYLKKPVGNINQEGIRGFGIYLARFAGGILRYNSQGNIAMLCLLIA